MIYGSVCSGIEAATVAWHPLGWRPAFFSEIEAFPRAVLAHHYPDVPLHGDFTTIERDQYGPIDLLVGGTPCQSFSIAGLRGGLADDRGNLAIEYLRLADRKRPRWLVWENVPGVLSSNGGRDFGAILGGMAELGYGFAYRVLDAQFFGVPQRRRRVFVVGCLGDWRSAAAVLFERHSLSGHPAPRREKGEGVTPILEAGARTGVSTTDIRAGSGIGAEGDPMFTLQAGKQHAVGYDWPAEIAPTLNAAFGSKQGLEDQHIRGVGGMFVRGAVPHYGHGAEVRPGDGDVMPAVAFALRGREGGAMPEVEGDLVGALRAANGGSSRSYIAASAVRRLTPTECERLQGFPDGYTAIAWRGKDADQCPDGPRYKALGNSMAVPCMVWLGQRIQMVHSLQQRAVA